MKWHEHWTTSFPDPVSKSELNKRLKSVAMISGQLSRAIKLVLLADAPNIEFEIIDLGTPIYGIDPEEGPSIHVRFFRPAEPIEVEES